MNTGFCRRGSPQERRPFTTCSWFKWQSYSPNSLPLSWTPPACLSPKVTSAPSGACPPPLLLQEKHPHCVSKCDPTSLFLAATKGCRTHTGRRRHAANQRPLSPYRFRNRYSCPLFQLRPPLPPPQRTSGWYCADRHLWHSPHLTVGGWRASEIKKGCRERRRKDEEELPSREAPRPQHLMCPSERKWPRS